MAGYHITHETPTGSGLTICNVTGGASNQLAFYLFAGSADETAPAEQQALLRLLRSTSVGTGGSALTEVRRNPLTSAPVGAGIGGTFAGEPAAGDVLHIKGVHQKVGYLLQLYPGREYITAASANNGMMILSVATSSAFPLPATMGWTE